MVLSNINTEIEYKESKEIDPEDKGSQSSLYEILLYDKPVVIALGKPKYTFSNKGVVFYPIYVVTDQDKIESQVGVYEILQSDILKIYDDEGDIDIETLGVPIFYTFVEKITKYLKSDPYKMVHQYDTSSTGKTGEKTGDKDDSLYDMELEGFDYSKEDDDDEEEDATVLKIPEDSGMSKHHKKIQKEIENGIYTIDETIDHSEKLEEESEQTAQEIKDAYKEKSSNPWIQKYMKNPNYNIREVESNGDCFFGVIRDAFAQIGRITTVHQLRAALALEATEKDFLQTRELFSGLNDNIRDVDSKMTKTKQIVEKELKVKATHAKGNREELDQILEEGKKMKKSFANLKKEKSQNEGLLRELFGESFKTVDTIEKFREYIQTSHYWADTWAISTMERILNIKMIIFSEEAYNDDSLNTVMNCGEVNKYIEEGKSFTPDYYVMTTFSGNHYRLITYKERSIFTFKEIPYHTKILIVNKCIEKNAGIYYMIQDFRNLNTRLGVDADAGTPDQDEDEYNDKYDASVVFQYYANSGKTQKPGKGAGETISKPKMLEYVELGQIDNWRRKLDDSWTESPFELDGHRWKSVEHYYQGTKFKKGFPDFYEQFALDSNSEISTDVDLAKKAGSQKGKAKAIALRPKSVEIDPDFYGLDKSQGRNHDERESAVRAKFTQNEDLKRLLILTKDAKLVNYVPKAVSHADNILLKVRSELV
jgi:hypothetical protein